MVPEAKDKVRQTASGKSDPSPTEEQKNSLSHKQATEGVPERQSYSPDQSSQPSVCDQRQPEKDEVQEQVQPRGQERVLE